MKCAHSVPQCLRNCKKARTNLIIIRKVLKITFVHLIKDNYILSQITEFIL